MKRNLSALMSGLILGLGLIISRMVDPAVVLAFLDVTGQWDPSLALVMASALVVVSVGYKLVLKAPQPLFSEKFHVPTRNEIDAPLIIGAILFGIGWGLVGLCPGPAITGISLLKFDGLMFLGPMVIGMFLASAYQNR